MAMFRSADDQTSDHDPQQPLFSYQERVGAFRALVHATSNMFEYSDRTLLDVYYDKASRLVSLYLPLSPVFYHRELLPTSAGLRMS